MRYSTRNFSRSLRRFFERLERSAWLGKRNGSDAKARRRPSSSTIAATECLEVRQLLTAVVAPPGLVAWWTGNNTGADAMGNNDGTLINGTTYAPGKVGQALSFDGVDDRLQIGNNDDLKLDHSLTIEGWILVKAFPATDHGEIFFRGDDRPGLDPYSLSTEPDGTINFLIDSGNGAVEIRAAVPLNQFVHVAATLDDATGAMRLYFNGTVVAQTTTAYRPFRDLDPTSSPSIGVGNTGGYPATPHNFPFFGLIDELSVYNRALTATEIQGIVNAGSDGKVLNPAPVPRGLVAWWTGNGTGADVTGNNDGTLINGTAYAPGMVGQALSFDGVDDRLQVGDNDDLKLDHSLSIEGWILVKGFPSTDHGEIFFRGDDRGGLDPYSLSTEPDGTINFLIDSGNGAVEIRAAAPLNQFVHVAATLDDATGAMRLYFNGVVVAQTTTTYRPFRDLDPTSSPSIGIGNTGGYPATPHNFPFFGLIDELSIYNRALSSAEIQSIYTAGTSGKIEINDPPVGTTGTVSTLINTAYTVKTSDFGFTDPNDNPSNSLLAVKFTLLSAYGTLTDNGVTVTANQVVSAADIMSGKLVFTPNTNVSGAKLFLAKFQVQDDGGTANGGHDLDASERVLYVQILVPNHAPVGTSTTVATAVNAAYTLKTSDFGFTDPNDNPANSLLAVKFTLLSAYGTLTDNGLAVTANQIVSAADISSGKLVFTPNTNVSGTKLFLAKFQVQDNGGTANGGQDLDPVAKVLYFRASIPNHAPVGTSTTVATAVNTAYTLKTSDFGFTDPNDNPANSFLAVKFTLLSAYGTLTDNGVVVTANQVVSVSDISSGKLVFAPNPNVSGTKLFLAKFQVQDNGGTAIGGHDFDADAKVLYVQISIPNHAPVGTSTTVSTLVNTAYTLKTADFGFSDPDDSPANGLLAVKFTLLSAYGTLTDNGVAVTANQSVSAVDISSGKLVFTPNTNVWGAQLFLAKFQVQDNGGTAFGGQDFDPTPKILYAAGTAG